MKIFKVNERMEFVCVAENTRSGFRHLATLFVDGKEESKGKSVYYNRTWERFEFQSVLKEALMKSSLDPDGADWKLCNDFIGNYKESDTMFKSTMMIAKLGDIFGKNKKEKNDWKKRMIKAGLGSSGLEFPDDWDKLSEDDKEVRLNKVMEINKK